MIKKIEKLVDLLDEANDMFEDVIEDFKNDSILSHNVQNLIDLKRDVSSAANILSVFLSSCYLFNKN